MGTSVGPSTDDTGSILIWVRSPNYMRLPIKLSYRYFGVILPCVLNLIGMVGFCVLNCILGGQTLASVAGGNISWRS